MDEEIEELKRQKDALMEELENIATAEWRDFDPDTRRCAYEFVLWAQSRARHTLNRVLSGDVTAPLPEDVKLVQVGPCSCSDHECGECMQPAPKVGAGETAKPVAWIRFCSDGCYEGPIMDEQIEDVRKNSGAWTPLYARHNVEFSGAPAALSPEAPLERRVGRQNITKE